MSNPGLQYDPKSYARYRPTYPANFYDSIYATADIPDYDTALDVGTGTGQVAQVLAERFRRVIGTDISSTQLGEAVRLPNIRYLETPAETLEGVEDDSVDLITVGVAYHWCASQRSIGVGVVGWSVGGCGLDGRKDPQAVASSFAFPRLCPKCAD